MILVKNKDAVFISKAFLSNLKLFKMIIDLEMS